ncbi:KAP family P-loop NTPase fold protein [Photobacterium kishitanii]|uniref:KAP family P-loop NTPase fold protein n=1 Tax=Photobacterium kishitanii TaxID=318456 RepID=UPI00069B1ED7|nr:P-loop NTPase fold protein [Photobacterium kishitanii]
MNIPFNWLEPEPSIDSNNETFPADQLDREKYAKFLTIFLAKQGYDDARDDDKKKRNYVLNLNAEWGAGKSYFLKRWAHDLKDHYPVVYIDAWKQDYSDDPLMTVVSSMIKQLRIQAGKDADKAVFKVSRKLIGLLKAAAPTLARGIATKYLGVDPLKIMEMADDKAIGDDIIIDKDGKPIDMGLAAKKMVEHLISEHDSKAKAIDSLKHNVEQWVEAVIGKNNTTKSYPAFIFIDELDRCRPSYAVEMLEAIKHIFDIPGVVFVVATDTEQLQHAVKAIYGEGFNAKQYLGRFFNSRYTFKAPSYAKLINVHCDVYKLSDEYLKTKKNYYLP